MTETDPTIDAAVLEIVDEHEEDFESIFSPKPRENPVYIDDLPDALVKDDTGNTALLLGKDNMIVIERWYEGRWLGTALYTVRSYNALTGDMALHDEANQQGAMANYITGPRHGWRFKLPIPGLNLNKREAPKQQPTRAGSEPPKPQLDESGNPLPKKIGRPKGSKNRSAAEVAEARRLEAEEKRLKKEAKLARKAGRAA